MQLSFSVAARRFKILFVTWHKVVIDTKDIIHYDIYITRHILETKYKSNLPLSDTLSVLEFIKLYRSDTVLANLHSCTKCS
ncbi:hypothetical protein C5167_013359 [Papaver somniferum]|uniref:Uncharacterized protein n=1 Tax=Papaver somniferum TaxID=3469 RepID=A0A4Y7J110_PAPSO|nr:hypothetical protein C5167_013359 [Papaver somniferum]